MKKKLKIFFFRYIIKIKKEKNMKKILIKLILKIVKSKKREEIDFEGVDVNISKVQDNITLLDDRIRNAEKEMSNSSIKKWKLILKNI
jgi:hypothetical protein